MIHDEGLEISPIVVSTSRPSSTLYQMRTEPTFGGSAYRLVAFRKDYQRCGRRYPRKALAYGKTGLRIVYYWEKKRRYTVCIRERIFDGLSSINMRSLDSWEYIFLEYMDVAYQEMLDDR